MFQAFNRYTSSFKLKAHSPATRQLASQTQNNTQNAGLPNINHLCQNIVQFLSIVTLNGSHHAVSSSICQGLSSGTPPPFIINKYHHNSKKRLLNNDISLSHFYHIEHHLHRSIRRIASDLYRACQRLLQCLLLSLGTVYYSQQADQNQNTTHCLHRLNHLPITEIGQQITNKHWYSRQNNQLPSFFVKPQSCHKHQLSQSQRQSSHKYAYKERPQIRRLVDLHRVQKPRRHDKKHPQMEINVDMGIFVKGPYSQQPVCPHEHYSNEGQSIETEVVGIQTDIVFKLSLDLIVLVHKFADQLIINSAYYAKYTRHQAIELATIDPNTVLKVIYHEDENGSKETDGMDDRKRQVELCCCHRQPMDYHNEITFEKIDKVNIVFVVHRHIVVPCNAKVQKNRSNSPHHGCFNHIQLVIVGVDEGQREEHLRCSKKEIRHTFCTVFFSQPGYHLLIQSFNFYNNTLGNPSLLFFK